MSRKWLKIGMASRFKREVNDLPKQSAKRTIHELRKRLTPLVPGVPEGDGRLCTPAASMSFGVCASRSGSACVKQAACKAVHSHKVFIMYRRGIEKLVFTVVKTDRKWYQGQEMSK